MNERYRFKIIPECNLILEQFQGDIQLGEIIDYKRQLHQDPMYNPNYRVVTDHVNCTFILSTLDTVYLGNYPKVYSEIDQEKEVIGLFSPSIDMHLLENLIDEIKGENIIFKQVFSTEELFEVSSFSEEEKTIILDFLS